MNQIPEASNSSQPPPQSPSPTCHSSACPIQVSVPVPVLFQPQSSSSPSPLPVPVLSSCLSYPSPSSCPHLPQSVSTQYPPIPSPVNWLCDHPVFDLVLNQVSSCLVLDKPPFNSISSPTPDQVSD